MYVCGYDFYIVVILGIVFLLKEREFFLNGMVCFIF